MANIDAGPGKDAGDGRPDLRRPACDVATHDGCSETQLCCAGDGNGANCVDVSFEECTVCNTTAAPEQGKCDVVVAVSCAARGVCECVTSSGEACSGDAPRCVADACVACAVHRLHRRGQGQCVAGVCSACNFGDGGTGCANPTPICRSDNSCVACDGIERLPVSV